MHCAVSVHVPRETNADPLCAFSRVNLDGALTIASAAAGVKRFVNLSTISVNGAETRGAPFRADDHPGLANLYAQSKWESEQTLKAFARAIGMDVVHAHLPMVYGVDAPGNFAPLVRAVRCGAPQPLGGLHPLRSFVSTTQLVLPA